MLYTQVNVDIHFNISLPKLGIAKAIERACYRKLQTCSRLYVASLKLIDHRPLYISTPLPPSVGTYESPHIFYMKQFFGLKALKAISLR